MHPSTHIDPIRPITIGRSVNATRAAASLDSLSQSMHLMGATMTYPRDSEIFGENEPAEYLYKVVSGNVRTYKILSDGGDVWAQRGCSGRWPIVSVFVKSEKDALR
jgi:Cyclic nucleotide-binding domain